METFEETLRIANVSATMFPSFPRALRLWYVSKNQNQIRLS